MGEGGFEPPTISLSGNCENRTTLPALGTARKGWVSNPHGRSLSHLVFGTSVGRPKLDLPLLVKRAEGRGFEPRRVLPQHAFQACALGR